MTDKLLHAETSFILTLFFGPVVAGVLSIAKEVIDYFRYGREVDNFSRMVIGDIIADALGILGGILWLLGTT